MCCALPPGLPGSSWESPNPLHYSCGPQPPAVSSRPQPRPQGHGLCSSATHTSAGAPSQPPTSGALQRRGAQARRKAEVGELTARAGRKQLCRLEAPQGGIALQTNCSRRESPRGRVHARARASRGSRAGVSGSRPSRPRTPVERSAPGGEARAAGAGRGAWRAASGASPVPGPARREAGSPPARRRP